MYLKSIEVQGFKSFANRIVFQFHNGITGIVGPNGSGKSNVADAVRWVLGEQRAKQLRGGNMQDVIFSGTENRKPLSYASVGITLDNSDHKLPVDFEEVTVTRKLYRSGESEYLMNGRSCRLKDINELFYDTGIGKEGYSIIGQGQIDKILSGKPEERRELFDEAAGIAKFKRRKNTSLKKLEEEQQNLVRVTDILSELEKQYGPLKKQSETAREYLKKKEELKKLDINLFLVQTETLRAQEKETLEALSRAEEELAETKKQYEAMKEEYAEVEGRIEEIDLAMETATKQLNDTKLIRQQYENRIDLLKEQIKSVRTSDAHYVERKETVEAEIQKREEELRDLKAQREDLEDQMREKEAQSESERKTLTNLQEEMARISLSTEEKKNEIMQILSGRASTKARLQHFHTLREQLRVQKAELAKQLLAITQETEVYRTDYEKYESEWKTLSQEIRTCQETIAGYESEINRLQQEITRENEQIRIGQSAYHREQSRLESLKNMTERYEGYGNSIRRVMEQKSRETGILGVVADLIRVDKRYETAVETALGGNIQNIVTKDEETAKRMISFLKQHKFGRATFLPLTSVRGSEFLKPEILEEDGVIGLAHTLVETDRQFHDLMKNLLGRTVVVKNIDVGIYLARKYRQSVRMVTPEGELLNPGGSMTGGAFKNSSSLLSRRREIEEFEKTVQMLKKDLDEAIASLETHKQERAGYYTKMDALKEEMQKIYVRQNTARMNLSQVQSRQKTITERKSVLLHENEGLESQLRELQENQDSIEIELGTSEELEKKLKWETEEEQRVLEEKKEQEQILQKRAEEAHLLFVELGQKENFLNENQDRILQEYTKYIQEKKLLEDNQGDNKREIGEKEQEMGLARQKIENAGELIEEIEQELQESAKEKEALSRRHKEFLSKRDVISETMSDLDKEAFRLGGKRDSLSETMEKQMNYMWEEYEITYNHALQYREEEPGDLLFMKKEIQRIRSEIRALGNVNVNAIEDFKNLEERYEFLKNQHEDLIEAEVTLKQIIEELDTAMRRQFEEEFAKIKEEFNSVFKQLFGGGKGTLELLEDEDILEAGIRIIAQPPGKKLQNMMQLSGGEKALTAIALLFAIQNLKPSPFCLLDEIEAALDDSNVTRFAQYLHKLTKNTQFIVITHRRGTMTAADRLYGITMQEKGVSTLVSVDLLENQLSK